MLPPCGWLSRQACTEHGGSGGRTYVQVQVYDGVGQEPRRRPMTCKDEEAAATPSYGPATPFTKRPIICQPRMRCSWLRGFVASLRSQTSGRPAPFDQSRSSGFFTDD